MNRYSVKTYRLGRVASSARAMRQALARSSRVSSARGPYRSRATIPVNRRSLRAATGEKKGVDTNLDNSPMLTTTNSNAGIILVNPIQQGTGSWNRVGRKVLNRSLRIKGWVIFINTPTTTTGIVESNSCRICVVWDKQPSQTGVPTYDTIFGITEQDGTESAEVFSPPKYDNMDRFVVLKEMNVDLAETAYMGQGTAPQLNVRKAIDCYIKLNNLETNYADTANPLTASAISTGALYVTFRAAVNSAQSVVGFNGIARLRYTD